MPRKKVIEEQKEEVIEQLPPAELIEQKPPDKKAKSKKKNIVLIELDEEEKETEVQEVQPVVEKPKRKQKVKEIQAVESTEEPIKVSTVHKVCFEKFTHNGKFYYLDSERDKLYEYLGSKKHGQYIGRWDSHLQEIIRDAEDSDEESI